VLLHPRVAAGGQLNDSMIVACFILLHVGARFLGESILVAQHGADLYMPFATVASVIWGGFDEGTLQVLRHVMWWLALGGILVFSPYFPYTKHAHLFMAPLNFLTRPQRTSKGELEPLNFEDDSIEQFGATTLFDLPKTQIFDAFACIQCNRCQDVCPAYLTGKELSPSALEVNKRYFIRENMGALAGEGQPFNLLGKIISESAVWACTSCGACVDICPVGDEPMYDILDIRRSQVLMESEFPAELKTAFEGMERQGNPWGVGDSRIKWIEGLDFPVPTVEENPNFDILYWTGCAVSYDERAQETARALVKVLHRAGVNFAILGDAESCTGDVARRAGNEYLYFELASANVETLNEVKPPRIVATCPHCLHNIGKEYHQFGGNYEVIHHTELLEELIQAGKLPRSAHPQSWSNVTFHDPCYLGRHNDIVDAPRNVLKAIDAPLIEMPRNKTNSFCCGAGGAQFWKEEEHGEKAVNLVRYEEAMSTGAETLVVGCPFCMQMFNTARSEKPEGPQVRDMVEMIAESL
jgi:Fe-S oxidoreductase